MKKLLVVLAIVAVAAGVHFTTGKQANANVDIQAGDLIRGEAFPAVYYMGADGFRYVFPNSATYFTWYDDFDGVVWISDAQLGQIQIGGNVTYRPGTRMIKIQSDPKTYAVDAHGTLRHITSEAVATGLYGANWNKEIDDVPDAFFSNYNMGDPITSASQFNKSSILAASSSINVDKTLSAPSEMSINASSYDPISVTISEGDVVRFTNDDDENHTATSDDLTWGSGTLMPGQSYLKKFSEAGTYTFFDSYNSQATGAIIVQ